MTQPLAGKTIAILVAHEFEDVELLYPMLRLSEEGASILVLAVDQQGPRSDHVGSRSNPEERVAQEEPAEAVALLRDVHAEPREEDDRDRVTPSALEHPARRPCRCDRARGERVIADDGRLIHQRRHAHAGRVRAMRLEGMPAQPVGLGW